MSADVHALAGAYALDALPSDERAFFERHLAACDTCCAEVAELSETAARLGSAAAQPPPADLRARILAAADVTRQLAPEPEPELGSVQSAVPRRRRERWLTAVAACLALAVLGLSGAVVSLSQRAQSPGGGEQITAVLGAEDLQMVQLEMEGGAGGFLYSPDQDQGVLVAAGMPAVDKNKTYELWLIHDGTPRPAGLFRPDAEGKAIAPVDGIVQGAELVAVTIEPAGGSKRPTGAVLASAEL